MMNNANRWRRVRIWLLYAFMYAGGPLLWGGWRVYRLELLSFADYVRCLLSPLTLAMLGTFLAGNLINISRTAARLARGGVTGLRWILRAHCAALVAFGTVGTFVFLQPLSAWTVATGGGNARGWLSTALIGSLSGASLVFLVYGYFTAAIFRLVSGDAGILRALRRFYSVLFPLGAALFVAASALAGRFETLTPLSGALLALPLATTGFLFVKTMARTKAAPGGAAHDVA